MSHRKLHQVAADGFTLVELVISITIIGVLTTTFYTFFLTSTTQYLAIQKDGMLFGDLAGQTQRVATVLRGLTDITAASSNDITFYAYFAPNDNYVSLVRYYKSAGGDKLFADVTPFNANPPNGTLITSKKQTYTVISSLYTGGSVSTFVYLDSANTPLSMPVSDLHIIKGIQVNLAVPSTAPSANANNAMSLQVSLRNRKTNL